MATSGINLSFERLSRSKRQVGYALLTRAPVATRSAAPRLACVKPVASVHPEPGSNSSLYYLFLFFFLQMKTTNNRAVRLPAIGYRTDGSILFPVLLLVYVNMSMNLRF